MKRYLIAAAALATLGAIAWLADQRGNAQGQSGNLPIGTQSPTGSAMPWLESKSNPNGGPYFPTPGSLPKHTGPQPYDGPDPNEKFFVRPELGPWLILITSYSTDRQTPDIEVKNLANRMVQELRSKYKMQAYVFNYGEDERRKEIARVAKYVKDRRAELVKLGASEEVNIGRVPTMHIDIQCAVLVGGYKNEAAARQALKEIRAIKVGPQELDRLPAQYQIGLLDTKQNKVETAKINPFFKSQIVPNPALRQERAANPDKLDLSVLKRLNADESFSLLKCPKPFTLAVKQFLVPAVVQPKDVPTGTLAQKLSHASGAGSGEEMTALKGHKLAELLHLHKWQAYVLHTKYATIVTVGGYDSPDDPRLLRDQQALTAWSARMPQAVQLVSQTVPMQVPR